MRQKLGETRSKFIHNHALISSDSHERTTLPNWPGSEVVFVITPQMGARFTQYFAHMPAQAEGGEPVSGLERFLFVLDGSVEVSVEGKKHVLSPEGYAFVPKGLAHRITAKTDARLLLIERPYLALDGQEAPSAHFSSTHDLTAAPLKGDDMLMLKKLIPAGLSYDFEVNTMEFSPGASLSYVETHFMEHGLLLLNGGGIYRLDDNWYSVEHGDTIWMGPYCPQWFGAIGRSNARYLIYKNWNRDPHVS